MGKDEVRIAQVPFYTYLDLLVFPTYSSYSIIVSPVMYKN
jgi:hypothetical protein